MLKREGASGLDAPLFIARPGPFPAQFVADEDAIGTEITHPMRAVGNVVADYSCADFLLAKQFERFLRVRSPSTNRRRQQNCQRKDL